MSKTIRYPAFTYTIHTNEYGFRDRATGRKNLSGRPFFVFLGASEVFGNGVEYDETFVGIFASAARKKGYDVLNMATGGHYFLDQERLLKNFITESALKPSSVLYCLNALHLPKFDQRNQHIVVKNGYAIDRNGWLLTYIRLMAGNLSSAFCFFRDAVRTIQEKWFHHILDSKSPEFLEAYSRENPIRDPQRVKALEAHLASFEEFCRHFRIDVIYVYLPLPDSFRLNEILRQIGEDPERYDTEFYHEFLHSYTRTRKIKFVDLEPVLQKAIDEGKELRFRLDPHFNALGNKIVGEYLVKEIL